MFAFLRRQQWVVALVLLAALLAGTLLWKRYGWIVADKVRSRRDPAPVVAQDHVLGEPSAPVTLIEYADLECVDCRRLQTELERLRHRVSFRWVFRHYPLERGGRGERLAVASECASRQGRFWQFIDAVYGAAIPANGGDPAVYYAHLSGADADQLLACMQGKEPHARVQADRDGGDHIGVNGTPTFFVNGRRYAGTPTEARLFDILGAAAR